MKQTRMVSSMLALGLLWWLLAVWMDNDFLLPYPHQVFELMKTQLASSTFYEAILITLLRSLSGLLLAFACALGCAFMAFQSRIFHDLFYPLLLLTRSVPNISYIILIQLWFGRNTSTVIISFLIIFPTIYSNLYHGLQHMDASLQQVIQLYPERRSYVMRRIYLPMLRGAMQASLSTGLSLTFKVGVMAEILGQVPVGIGRQLNICRITSDMPGIFAWTGWIILLLLMMESFLHLVTRRKQARAS